MSTEKTPRNSRILSVSLKISSSSNAGSVSKQHSTGPSQHDEQREKAALGSEHGETSSSLLLPSSSSSRSARGAVSRCRLDGHEPGPSKTDQPSTLRIADQSTRHPARPRHAHAPSLPWGQRRGNASSRVTPGMHTRNSGLGGSMSHDPPWLRRAAQLPTCLRAIGTKTRLQGTGMTPTCRVHIVEDLHVPRVAVAKNSLDVIAGRRGLSGHQSEHCPHLNAHGSEGLGCLPRETPLQRRS